MSKLTKYKRAKVAEELLGIFIAAHPNAIFPKDSDQTVPLKVQIHKDLQKAHPEIARWRIACFIGRYVQKDRYLKALVRHQKRFGLDGEPVDDVTDEHRARAQQLIERRKAFHRSRGKTDAEVLQQFHSDVAAVS